MKQFILIMLFLSCFNVFSQSIKERLSLAVQSLEADSQCKHGIIGLLIVDGKTGVVIFDKNADIGLAPASTQKIITSITAFELLGQNYTYKTQLGYTGKINEGTLSGNIIITGSGDPTLGSWRYTHTREENILADFARAIKTAEINRIAGQVLTDDNLWNSQSIPDGWIWQDIGNYYGAGASAVNWRENQYDIILASGPAVGDAVKILATIPANVQGLNLVSELAAGKKGSGDNAFIYLPLNAKVGYIRGTIPVNEEHFVVSGAMPDPGGQLRAALSLHANLYGKNGIYNAVTPEEALITVIHTHTSPPLDSINYWFLKKSINLYGEALLKTMAYEKAKYGSTDTGVNIIKNFWSNKGIDKAALSIKDGSGLSPANRVTARALTMIMQYAKKQPWFSSFYNALPEVNGLKMKSGSIGGVVSYTGYIKNKKGDEVTFAFMVNNFNGSGSALRSKMWRLLDALK